MSDSSNLQRKEQAQMSIYAVAKKEPYVITSEERKEIFSTPKNMEARARMIASARLLETTCLKKGQEVLSHKQK